MSPSKESYLSYLEKELKSTKELLSRLNKPAAITSYLQEITLLEESLMQFKTTSRQESSETLTDLKVPTSNMPPTPSSDIPTSSASTLPIPIEPIIVPDRVFTLEELQTNYNGLNGNPSYVGLYGIVFDVSNIATWGGGTHFGLYAGKDATEGARACGFHNPSFIMRIMPAVGRLEAPLADGITGDTGSVGLTDIIGITGSIGVTGNNNVTISPHNTLSENFNTITQITNGTSMPRQY